MPWGILGIWCSFVVLYTHQYSIGDVVDITLLYFPENCLVPVLSGINLAVPENNPHLTEDSNTNHQVDRQAFHPCCQPDSQIIFYCCSTIHREKRQPASLFVSKHPHGNNPLVNTHPNSGQARPLHFGNDNSTKSRQSRSQTIRPDPLPGEFIR